jgi:hypothetical protein
MPKPSRTVQIRTPQRARKHWDKAFLDELRLTGIVAAACLLSGIGRQTAYDRRNTDMQFKADWDAALEESGEWLEVEARRRAEEGTLKPVYYKGELVGFEREYSDTLMGILLKANNPRKYANKLIVEISPEHAAILERMGKSASELWNELMQELADAPATSTD